MKALLIFLRKLRFLKYLNVKARYPNHSIFTVPLIKGVGYDLLFDQEPWIDKLVINLSSGLSQNTYFLDVGVNIGQTLLKVKSISTSISYFGFEPNPNCLFYLSELISSNDLGDVTIFPLALSDKSGVIDLNLYTDKVTDQAASIIPEFRGEGLSKIKISATNNVEPLLPKDNQAGIIKIDVEGGELEVIKVLSVLIDRDRPFIICEILPVYKMENKFRLERQNELEQILKTLRYQMVLINTDLTLTEIDSVGVHSDINKVNYLFCPEEKKRELDSRFPLK